ncbi:MAG: hypothetical protein ACK4NM_18725 [Hydrogenophaga sp.]
MLLRAHVMDLLTQTSALRTQEQLLWTASHIREHRCREMGLKVSAAAAATATATATAIGHLPHALAAGIRGRQRL